MNQPQSHKTKNPWTWIPTLYFGQGLPYVVVMSVAVIMYKRFGLSNTDIAYIQVGSISHGLLNPFGVHL